MAAQFPKELFQYPLLPKKEWLDIAKPYAGSSGKVIISTKTYCNYKLKVELIQVPYLTKTDSVILSGKKDPSYSYFVSFLAFDGKGDLDITKYILGVTQDTKNNIALKDRSFSAGNLSSKVHNSYKSMLEDHIEKITFGSIKTIIDMHVHTRKYSYDSNISIDQILATMDKRKINGILIAEHNKAWPKEKKEMVKTIFAHKQRVALFGIEAKISDNSELILLNMDEYFNKKEFSNFNLDQAIEFVNDHNGYIIIPHPYRVPNGVNKNIDKIIDNPSVLGIEAINGKLSEEDNQKAIYLAKSKFLPSIGGSDAHNFYEIGKAVTRFNASISSEQELIDNLKDFKNKTSDAYINELWYILNDLTNEFTHDKDKFLTLENMVQQIGLIKLNEYNIYSLLDETKKHKQFILDNGNWFSHDKKTLNIVEEYLNNFDRNINATLNSMTSPMILKDNKHIYHHLFNCQQHP